MSFEGGEESWVESALPNVTGSKDDETPAILLHFNCDADAELRKFILRKRVDILEILISF